MKTAKPKPRAQAGSRIPAVGKWYIRYQIGARVQSQAGARYNVEALRRAGWSSDEPADALPHMQLSDRFTTGPGAPHVHGRHAPDPGYLLATQDTPNAPAAKAAA